MSTDSSESNKVVRLAVANSSVERKGKAAVELVVAFLREWADSIEKGETEAEKAVLLLYDTKELPSEEFRIRSRRCNVGVLEQVGMMQLAIHDVCEFSTEDLTEDEK